MATWQTVREVRGLCIDVENLPGTYGPGDYTHPKITAVGWGWRGDQSGYRASPKVHGRTFARADVEGMREVAEEFRSVWDEADFVIGHNIRLFQGGMKRGQVLELRNTKHGGFLSDPVQQRAFVPAMREFLSRR